MGLIFDNFFWELAILFVTVAFFLFLKIKKRLRYFEERGIPYYKPSIMESIKTFKLDFTQLPAKIYEKAGDEPMMGSFLGIKPIIVIKDPALVQNILIKDFSHFHDHAFEIDTKSNPLDGHLFNMKGDKWRTLRHKLVPTFSSGKLKGMVSIMAECADRLIKELKHDANLCQDVKLKELFKKYTVGVIASSAFGIDPESIQDPNCEFSKYSRKLQDLLPFQKQMLKTAILILNPAFIKLAKLKLFPKDVEDFFISLTRQPFESRKKTGMKRNDFVQLLLELKEKGSVEVDAKELEEDEKENLQGIQSEPPSPAKLELTDELLCAQMFVFIVGGYENSAYMVAITTYVLSKCKQVQERVRQEIKEAKEKHGSFNYNALKDMKLLNACIDEALRLHPPLGFLMRECTKSYTLSDGRMIDKGMGVFIPSQSLYIDSKYWDKPDEINPNRFLEGNILPGTYIPFGDGPRICIAQRFALLQGKLVLAKLVENFEILPNKKNKEPLKIKPFISVEIIGGLWGNFKPLEK